MFMVMSDDVQSAGVRTESVQSDGRFPLLVHKCAQMETENVYTFGSTKVYNYALRSSLL